MDLSVDVVWRSLIFEITHHNGFPNRLTLYSTVKENGAVKRQEELSMPLERLEDLVEILASEVDVFATASGDNGTRSLF